MSDGKGGTDTATVTVSINGAPENNPPVACSPNPDTKEDCVCKITLKADDGDPGVDQNLTYFLDTLPENGKLYATKDDAQDRDNPLGKGLLAGNVVWFKSDRS